MQAMLATLVNLLEGLDRIVVEDARPVLKVLKDLLVKLSGDGWEVWFEQLKKFLRRETCWTNGQVRQVAERFKAPTRLILKLISGAETLELDETDGKATIAKAKDTFSGWIDPNFKGYGCDVKSEPTKKTQVSVHEMIEGGTFAKIWNGMSDDLNSLCLTQSQIIQFVVKYRKWLRTEGFGTLFLFKAGNEFFVACVYICDGGQPGVGADRFSDDSVWDAEYRRRIVVPRLTT